MEENKNPEQQNSEKRNIYADNIFDINSSDDISDYQIHMLSKKGEDISFEMGNDFFSFADGKLTQYPDFKSLHDNKNGRDATFTDYGTTIIEGITTSPDLENLKDFTLQDRDSYIKQDLVGGINVPLHIVKKNMDELKKVANVNIPVKELEQFSHIANAVIDTLALFLSVYKAYAMHHAKKNMVNQALTNLTMGDAHSLVKNNKNLLQEVPEIQESIKKLSTFTKQLSITDDFKKMSPIQQMNTILSAALQDRSIMENCEKVAMSPSFKKYLQNVADRLNDINKELHGKTDEILTDLDPEQKQQALAKFREFLTPVDGKTSKLDDLIIKDLGINLKDNDEKAQFMLATNYISNSLLGPSDPEQHLNLMRFITSTKQLQNTDTSKIASLIEKIAKIAMEVEPKEKQKSSHKMSM